MIIMKATEKSDNILNLLKQSSVYYIGSMIAMLSSIISLPILTRMLSKSDYGILSLVMLTMFLVLVPAKFGMQNSAFYYFDEFKLNKRPEKLDAFYSTLFWGSLFISIIVAIIYLFVGNVFLKYLPNKNFVKFTAVIAGLVIAEAMIIRIRNFLRVEQRSKFFAIVGIIHSYGKIIVGFLFFYFVSKTVQGFLIGSLLASVVLLVGCFLIAGWQKLIKLNAFSVRFFKESIHYGYPFIGIEASSLFMKYADRYLIDYFIGTSAVGVYSVSGNLSMAISNGIFSSIWLAVTPMYMKIYRTDGEEKTAEFVSKSINFLFLMIIPIIFGLSVMSNDVIEVLASKKYVEAAVLVPYLITAAAIWGLTPIFATGFYIKKKNNIYSRVVMISVIFNVSANLYMIPRYGIQGAAITSLLTYIITFVVTTYLSSKYLRLKIDIGSVIHYLIAAVIMSAVLISIMHDINIVNLLLKIFIGAVSYISVVLVLNSKIRIECRKILSKTSLSRLFPG